jgi:hypothetical protein
MSMSWKSLLSLSLVLLLGLTLSCDASATQSRDKSRTKGQIEACLNEIGRHADYTDAARVVHWIASLEQKNLVELRIVIDTTVVLTATARTRDYRASCVTDSMGGVVDFRIDTTRADSQDDRPDAHS